MKNGMKNGLHAFSNNEYFTTIHSKIGFYTFIKGLINHVQA